MSLFGWLLLWYVVDWDAATLRPLFLVVLLGGLDSLFSGGCAPHPPRRFSSDHPTVYPVFEIYQTPSAGGNGPQPDIMLTAKFALTAADEALCNAKLNRKMLQDKRVGVCIGTTVGSAMNNEEFYWDYRSGRRPPMEAIP